ncbi:MAG: prolyl oligopeptidase family serine peptidase [Bacteroidales bacterium]
MKRIFVVLIFVVFFPVIIFAQKKPLDHSVYDKWSSIGGFQITDDGKYATYYRSVDNGDGALNVVELKKNIITTIPRGTKAKLTKDGKYVCFVIRPEYTKTKEAKEKKLKGDKMPKDSLGILALGSMHVIKIPFLEKFDMAKEGRDYIVYETNPPADTLSAKDVKTKSKAKHEKGVGKPLMVYQLSSGNIDTLMYVSDYKFSNGGDTLFFVRTPKSTDSTFKAGIYIYELKSKLLKTVIEGCAKNEFTLPVLSEDEKALAFYANSDTSKKADDNVEIYVYKDGYDRARIAVSNSIKGLDSGWCVSKRRSLNFSKDNQALYFGISSIQPKKDTSENDSEVAKLDVWHYNDKYIQTHQKARINQDLRRSYLSRVLVDNPTEIVQLSAIDYPVARVAQKWSADWAFAVSSERYAIESQWDSNPKNDLYVISVTDGNAKLVQEGQYISHVSDSPDGNFLIWYNNQNKNWYSYDVKSDTVRLLTEKINVPLWNELHDTPEMPNAYGGGIWRENDEAFFVYDKYDVWQIDPLGMKAPFMVTDGLGRQKGITFRMLDVDDLQLPPGTPGVTIGPIKKDDSLFFTAFDNASKGYGYYIKDMKARHPVMKALIMESDFSLGYFNKAKNSNVITYTKSNFMVSPNMWVTKDWFKTSRKVTEINPQQKDYNWGTCELVKWNAGDGRLTEGLLFKPEDFDPTKKYPMVVYFYERTSQYKNMYRNPAPSKSTINVTYFVSNGYLVFMPDIHYKIGHPGKSAIDCIVPGVEKLCENSWVDRENIGIQGQSWGGYQVAYIVTQTDIFKAAGAGAPVANMTSAYGGIRWGEGVSRQFQYESTQSRIGKSLWDEGGLELYIENSPLFHADKIKTPLLIMDNDKDECVPWYQGIELFTAMRRLGKVVWMLQYNDETHNLTGDVNSLDYTIRLYQFFDHYLKGKPMPVWMKYGVPATKKGIDWGLELVTEP